MDSTEQKLFELAKRVKQYAYAPISKFHVGSALITDKGNFYRRTLSRAVRTG